MAHINQIIQQAQIGSPTTQYETLPNSTSKQATQATVDAVVSELTGIFSAWRQAFKPGTSEETEYKRQFFKAMAQLGIHQKDQIKHGLKNARRIAAEGRQFMPSGAEFCGWCQPRAKDLGLESFEYALDRTMARDWESLHPAFQEVASRTETKTVWRTKPTHDPELGGEQYKVEVAVLVHDIEAIRQGPMVRSEALFRKLYDEVLRRVAKGDNFVRKQSIEYRPYTNPSGVVHTKAGRDHGNTVLKKLLKTVRS